MQSSPRDAFDLDGKVALITGASKGIGESIARLLAQYGARVIVSSRKQESVDAVAESIRSAGGEAVAVAAHVGDPDARRNLVERSLEAFDGIDILVNNAAVNPYFGPMLGGDEAIFDKIMGVNLKAPFELAKAVHPSMEKRGGGSIVNISSIGGISPEPMLGLYSVSKSALISLTKVLAAEWGPAGIRVNAVCPGLVRTKFSQALWQTDEILEQFLKQVPLRRIAEADEIAPLVLFLASDASRYATGSAFVLDGGATI